MNPDNASAKDIILKNISDKKSHVNKLVWFTVLGHNGNGVLMVLLHISWQVLLS